MKRPRALLADDHPLTLEGMRVLIESQLEIVGIASNGKALVEEALRLKPDLIILDMNMPLLSGIDAAVRIKKDLPDVKLLFVTMHMNRGYLKAALNTGAAGYVLKSAAREELLDAIQTVISGGTYISPHLSNPQGASEISGPTGDQAHLSLREREILQLIAQGKSNKEIAFLLSISIKTVTFHRENIKRKLGLRTIAELTKHAIDRGLLS
jgi:DNA-binding NarL/FixJ family response regulator